MKDPVNIACNDQVRMQCVVLADTRTYYTVGWYKDGQSLDQYIGERINLEELADTFQGFQKYINTLVIRMVNIQDEG